MAESARRGGKPPTSGDGSRSAPRAHSVQGTIVPEPSRRDAAPPAEATAATADERAGSEPVDAGWTDVTAQVPTRSATDGASRPDAAVTVTSSTAGPRPVGGALGSVEPITPMRVLAHKPGPTIDPRLVLVRKPDSSRAAGFRVLRHRLVELGNPRVIVVSSPERYEGKTTCAVNLALALAECGRARVLLLEANSRFPALSGLFGFVPPECFATQVGAHRDRPHDPWCVVEVFSPSTIHVAAVHPQHGGRPLLDAPAFSLAVQRLKAAGYDSIVIDTPPVLGSADVNVIQDAADGVLLTSWSGRSSGKALMRAVEQLAPTKILGTVLIEDPAGDDDED